MLGLLDYDKATIFISVYFSSETDYGFTYLAKVRQISVAQFSIAMSYTCTVLHCLGV